MAFKPSKIGHLIAKAGLLLSLLILGLNTQTMAKPAKKEKKSGKKNAKGSREKFIVREAQVQKDQKSLDFDATDIAGERKVPLGSLINQNKSDKEFDLIKIRLRWHPEMIQSTASIETGRSK